MRALRARGGVVIGTLAVCVLLLSGCVAGKDAPTSKESPAIDGTNASIGSLLLRDMAIAPPANGPSYSQGDNAALQVIIVNNGRTADTLTGITTSAASSVAQTSSSASSSESSGSSESSSASGSSSPSSPSSSSAGSTATGSESASGGSFAPVTLGANSAVSFGLGTGQALVLTSLKSQLFPAAVVNVTFTFQNAGSITVEVPVQLTTSQNETGQVVTAGLTPETSASE